MAPIGKHAPILLLIVIISSVHTEARLGQFLTTYMYAPEPEPQALSPAHSVSPAAAPMEVEGGFGFGPGLAPSQPNIGYGPAPAESRDNPYGIYNVEFSLQKTTQSEVSDKEDGILGDEVANENFSTDQYNAGNQYYSSNDRYLDNTGYSENAKYSYDANNGERNNGNEASEGYYGYGEQSKYEFDNMEEYERQQGYPDTDRLYDP